jgi:transcriptional regulator GlxA family with amidase domain
MSTIAIVASPHCYTASLGAMVDAHALLGEGYRANPAMGDYARIHTKLQIVSGEGGDIQFVGGRRFAGDGALAGLDKVRIIYLPGFELLDPGSLDPGRPATKRFYTWLRERAAAGTLIGACGESVWHLALAGLLDGRNAVMDARHADAFRRRFPLVNLREAASLAADGTIMTAAGSYHAGALVIRLIGEAFGPHVAGGLANRDGPWPGGGGLSSVADPLVARAQTWIREHFASNFRIADLAANLGVSHQTLIRRFAAAGAEAPRAFAQRARIEAAVSMLAETDRSVAEIAQLVGYSDVPSFRRIFIDIKRSTPGAFRRERRQASAQLTRTTTAA